MNNDYKKAVGKNNLPEEEKNKEFGTQFNPVKFLLGVLVIVGILYSVGYVIALILHYFSI